VAGQNLFISAALEQAFSYPAAKSSRRRDNDLSATIKYLRITMSGAAGIDLGAQG
jgi:hypothetical protein